MSENIIFHNPRCTKSRQTVALLQKKKAKVEIVEYLKTPPSISQLKFICSKLGIEPTDLIRTKEKVFQELGLSVGDKRSKEQWFKLLHEHPILIERPIVIYNDRVAIGRPPENVLAIL